MLGPSDMGRQDDWERFYLKVAGNIESGHLAVLAGAGVSHDVPSCLPLGNDLSAALVSGLEHQDLGPREVCHSVCPLDCRRDRTWTALYARIARRPAFRLEVVLEMVTRVLGVSGLGVLDFMNRAAPNRCHRALAALAGQGVPIITTNFDDCIEQAYFSQTGCQLPVSTEGEDAASDAGRVARSQEAEASLVKLHGTLRHSDGRNGYRSIITTVETLGTGMSSAKQRLLDICLDGRMLLIVGYSATDFFDVYPYLAQQKYAASVVWVQHAEESDKMTLADCTSTASLPRHVIRLLSGVRQRWVCTGPTREFLSTLAGATSEETVQVTHSRSWRDDVAEFLQAVPAEARASILAYLLENAGIQWAHSALLGATRGTWQSTRPSLVSGHRVSLGVVSILKGMGKYRQAYRLARKQSGLSRRYGTIREQLEWQLEVRSCLVFLNRGADAHRQIDRIRLLAQSEGVTMSIRRRIDIQLRSAVRRLRLLSLERSVFLPVIGRLLAPRAKLLAGLVRDEAGETIREAMAEQCANFHTLLNARRMWMRAEGILASLERRQPAEPPIGGMEPLTAFDELDSLFGRVNTSRAWAEVLCSQGKGKAAAALLAGAGRLSREIGDFPGVYKAYQRLARILLRQGRRRMARICARAALAGRLQVETTVPVLVADLVNLLLLYVGIGSTMLDTSD